MARRLISAFNAGELSPLLDGRVDIEKYQNGCRILENCVPKIYGGAFGRAGMEYMGESSNHAKKTRLIEFIFSASTNFILEFGDETVRFWSNGTQVMSGGSPLEIVSPYGEADLFDIQYIQINDVMYLVDGKHLAQKLTRVADDNWTLEEVEWKFPALKDENTETTTLAASATSGSNIDLVASADLFEVGHVGAYFQLAHRRDNSFVELALTASGDSAGLRMLGKYDIFTYGTWTGTLKLQRKDDLGQWETIRSWKGKADKNVSVAGEAQEEQTLRFSYDWTSTGAGSPRAVLEAADSRIYGLVKVTSVTDARNAKCTVVKDLMDTTVTLLWSEGAWSDVQGHPRTVTMHEQSLVFAGCDKQPLTVWGSVLGDFENFKRSTLADASYAKLIGSTRGNAIVWSASTSAGLVIGTQGDEWVISSSNDQRISATVGTITRQSSYGSAYIQPTLGNDAVMFVQRGRRKFREFVYVFEKDGYTAPDMTLLAEHIAPGGFKQLAFSSTPDPVVWAVTQDGGLLSMTFERDQNVVGWSRHITQGEVESVAVIYGEPGEADEVWLLVKRTIKEPVTGNDLTRRYLERLDPRKWLKLDSGDVADFIYSDCAKVIELSPASTTVDGLEHLEGKDVVILADGFIHPVRTVANGVIELQVAASKVVVGLSFTPRIQPSRTEIQLGDGSAQGRMWKLSGASVKLWRTLGCEYADAPDAEFFDIPIRDVETSMDEPQPPFTGERRLHFKSQHRGGLDVTLRQSLPLPFHVLALIPEFDISGA